MTPKEKAESLVDQFMNIKKQKLTDYSVIYYPTARQCALIVVDEIIKALRKSLPEVGLGKGYWYDVKQEIENL